MRPIAVVLALVALAAPSAAAAQDLPFEADPAHSNAARQAKRFAHAGRERDAARMRALSLIPQARWFNGGTPKQVRRDVDALVTDGDDPPPGAWWPRYALGLIRRASPPL